MRMRRRQGFLTNQRIGTHVALGLMVACGMWCVTANTKPVQAQAVAPAQVRPQALPVPTPPPAPAAPTIPFATFIEQLWPQAQAQGISRPTFDLAFRGVTPDLALPDLILPGAGGGERKAQQAEFVRSPAEYLNPKTLANLLSSGQSLNKQWAPVLAKIEQTYPVPRTMVLAIWGRETAFGTYKPPHYAIKVLATQAYLGRRKERFRDELIAALKMIQDGHVAIPEFKASWAGAFGLTQFMPGTFVAYMDSGEGTGAAIDIVRSAPDALATTANFVAASGFIEGLRWGVEVNRSKGVAQAWVAAERRPLVDAAALA
jgi:lytic murein transglycosylase